MRIASLLPAATEMACALGLEEELVAVSFECDYPKSVTRYPRMVNSALDMHSLTPGEIDAAVTARLRSGQSLYEIDEELLKTLRPDLILTQDLCQVCAPSGNELSQALKALDYEPQVLFMSPRNLSEVLANLYELAKATGREFEAQELLQEWQIRILTVQTRAALRYKPRVSVLEWADPIFCAGHWLAEMIETAGGNDRFARKGEDSARISWDFIRAWEPEVLVLAPCGYNAEQAREQLKLLEVLPGWKDIPAVRNNRVHAVDANAYFVRPGPRLIEGLELLEKMFEI